MILKVSCISFSYTAAFMRVDGQGTLSTSLADPDPEVIEAEAFKKFSDPRRQYSLKVSGALPLAPSPGSPTA